MPTEWKSTMSDQELQEHPWVKLEGYPIDTLRADLAMYEITVDMLEGPFLKDRKDA